jgi:anthranilate phosphoribosyltransferase
MKNVMPVRKKLGIRTIFNLVGPLSNPASPGFQVVGVSEEWMLEPIAKALSMLGVKRAAVVHGRPGIDEVSPISTTQIYTVSEGEISKSVIDVTDFGVQPVESFEHLKVRNVEESKEKVLKALRGEGPEFVFLALNSALALHLTRGVDLMEAYNDIKEFVGTVDVLERVRSIVRASGGEPTF